MTDHLIPTNPTLRMTSLEVAELTEKNHLHVMRDIRDLIDQQAIDESSFGLISYTDSMNRQQPMYTLDFEASMVLVTGYDAPRRAKVIKRWLALERGEAAPALAGTTPAGLVPAEKYIALLEENCILLKGELERIKTPTAKRRFVTPAEKERIAALKAQGLTCAEIAKEIGRKWETVKTVLYRLGKEGKA